MWHLDPLDYPERREQSKRKTKSVMTNSVRQIERNEFDEPEEYVDSDTDPAWTPQDEKVCF